ncbi:hypothetical protein LCGC14_2196270, partial [marine sediment metagenome]
MVRYVTTEERHRCPTPGCEVLFTSREGIPYGNRYIVCPRCDEIAQRRVRNGAA